MKRYIYIIAAALLTILSSCIKEEFNFPEENPSASKGIQIIGAAEDFDEKNVATRADGDVSDSHITEMTMFIFDANDNMIQGYDANKNPISSAVNIAKPNPTFLIETSRYDGTGIIASMDGDQSQFKYYDNKADDLAGCKIYIVANAYAQLTAKGLLDGNSENGEITSLETLQAALLDVDATLDMPKNSSGEYIGFPMIGTHSEGTTFNLSYNSGQSNSGIATIPLKKLYSKVRFRMQVNSKQIVDGGQVPKFTIKKAEVYNVPTKVRMGYAAGDYTSVIGNNGITDSNLGDYYQFTGNAPFVITDFTKRTINHSSSATTNDYLEFGFYMPEHMVTPNTITYPTNITEEAKQYYKPTRLNAVNNGDGTTTNAKIAPFVRIYGSYTDHNGQIKDVEYDIYLGQNNSDDFEVKRNQQLNNYLTITGLTNHKDAYPDADENISIDHRVNVEAKGFNLSMEREAILDAHFEVRPIDIELQAGSSVTVVIPEEEDCRSWIAMESDAVARTDAGKSSNLYVNTSDSRKGVRKYFTTNLVSELTEANSGTVKVSHSGTTPNTEYHRIWFYIDENPNVYDKSGTGKQDESGDHTVNTTQYRLGKVQFYYAASGTPDTTGDPAATINFQQWNLWRVWNSTGTRYYDIEHEEEYLNNYASDQGYGATQNGMAWGLDGLQLSNKYDAAYLSYSGGFLQQIIELISALFGGNFTYEDLVNDVFREKNIKYDFYMSRDVADNAELKANATVRDYNGLIFNKEIATTLLTNYPTNDAAKLNYSLNELEKSAFAYCYNKNKRNANGDVCFVSKSTDSDGNAVSSVNSDNLKWYLPSIDEMEDIARGAYDEFDGVFQKNFYWSSQPAYNPVKIDLDVWRKRLFGSWYDTEENSTGYYYFDNTVRARATSVETNADGTFKGVISSGSELYRTETGELRVPTAGTPEINFNNPTEHNPSYENHPGNLLRTEKARIRAVYRSGTVTATE